VRGRDTWGTHADLSTLQEIAHNVGTRPAVARRDRSSDFINESVSGTQTIGH